MVITLIENAIYLQPITAHNRDELDPHRGKLNTFPPSQQNSASFYLIDSQEKLFYIYLSVAR